MKKIFLIALLGLAMPAWAEDGAAILKKDCESSTVRPGTADVERNLEPQGTKSGLCGK